MRVNVYAEEMTDEIQIVEKQTADGVFTGLRILLHLPVTVREAHPLNAEFPPHVRQIKGPFMHHPNDDDSSAVTFWGKRDLIQVLRKALRRLEDHYDQNAFSECAGNTKASQPATQPKTNERD